MREGIREGKGKEGGREGGRRLGGKELVGRFLAAFRPGRVWSMFTTENQNHTRQIQKQIGKGEENPPLIRRTDSAGK